MEDIRFVDIYRFSLIDDIERGLSIHSYNGPKYMFIVGDTVGCSKETLTRRTTMTKKQVKAWRMVVGQRLREEWRCMSGPRQEYKLAKLLGISQGSLSDILNGKSSPSALTLKAIDEKTLINIVWLIA